MSEDLHTNLDEYVLGLLDPEEEQKVESHLVRCSVCRNNLTAEQRVLSELSSAVCQITSPSGGQVEAMWPGIASRLHSFQAKPIGERRSLPRSPLWQTVVSTFGLVALVSFLLLQAANQFGSWPAATHTPALRIVTASPTASTTPTEIAATAVYALRSATGQGQVATPVPAHPIAAPIPRPSPPSPQSGASSATDS